MGAAYLKNYTTGGVWRVFALVVEMTLTDAGGARGGLFVSQRDYGVDAHGAPRRNVTGRERDEG